MNGGRIFPFMRKPDVTCSNVFIIDIGAFTILIDTGVSRDLMDSICKVLAELSQDNQKPILIIFSHTHVDHIYLGLVDQRFQNYGKVFYVCHTSGSDLLKSGDQKYTQAELVGIPIPSLCVDIPLFQKNLDLKGLSNIPEIGVEHKHYQLSDSVSLECVRFIFPNNQCISFWEVPGHSADSIAVQAGSLLHVGDIPFATSPGIAGVPGWNPKELSRTIIRLSWIILNQKISIICQGHGNACTSDELKKNLMNLQQDLDAMPEITMFDKTRLSGALLHATDLIDEAHRILPILAGRIMLLRYRLEELEEEDLARKLEKILPDEEIDKILIQFSRYYDDFKSGLRCEYQVILKAIQTLQKIKSFLSGNNVENIIDSSLLRRTMQLFSDLLSSIQGNIPTGSLSFVNPVDLIQDVAHRRSSHMMSDEEILLKADDEDEFKKVLVCRLAEYQNLSDIKITIDSPIDPQTIYADSERLSDFFSVLIDYYYTYGADEAHITINTLQEFALIKIVPNGACFQPCLPLSRALIRSIKYAGGELVKIPGKESEEMILKFSTKEPSLTGSNQN